MKTAPQHLEAAAKTYRERNAIYGDNYKNFGNMASAIFPKGLHLESVDSWNRMGVFLQVLSKLTRYAENWEKGGHADSIHDLSVYAAMLAELDEEISTRGDAKQIDLPLEIKDKLQVWK